MSRRFWAPLILVTAFAQGQEVQPTIRVEVRSAEGPVRGAEVNVRGHSSRTGSDGVAISPGALGRIDISVTKKGFFPARASLDIDAAKEWTVQIELQPQKGQEEKVTVHATRNDVRVQDSPLHVEVVSQDEINEELAMRSSDISMLLNEMGGMRVQTTSPGLGAASVRVQGMVGRYTAFLSDGLPLFGQQGAGLGLLQIPPMDLAQVEVIKGTAPRSTVALQWPGLSISSRVDRRTNRFMNFFSTDLPWGRRTVQCSWLLSSRHIGAHRFSAAHIFKSSGM